MKRFLVSFSTVVFLLTAAGPSHANNLSISNVSLESRSQSSNTAVVEFDISWANSWRDASNWDAVWVFFKVSKNGGAWVHGKMQTAGTNPAGTDDGSGTAMTRYVPSDKAGALLFRSGSGSGTASATNVHLVLDYGSSPVSAGDYDTIQVRVFGIEMVYVAGGVNFNIGMSCSGACTGYGEFYDAGDTSTYDPVTITSTQPYVSNDYDGWGIAGDIAWYPDGYSGSLPGSRTQLNANFPTGYDSFYLMKYELSQGQYRDFLNTLSSTQQSRRTYAMTNNYYAMTNTASPSYRQTIKYHSSGTAFVCDLDDDDTGDESNDGEWIAMNDMLWTDCAAFADWAGLRPYTELEFEKAGKGTAYSSTVKACGLTSPTQAKAPISNSGYNNETCHNTGSCLMNVHYFHGQSEINAPLRVGFAATSTTSRAYASAGFYGNMEFSGNVREYTVTIGHSAGRAFQGSHGDGILSTTSSYEANATNTDWPGIDGTVARGVTGNNGIGQRGGSFGDFSSFGSIDYRYYAAYTSITTRSNSYINRCGCRLARDP